MESINLHGGKRMACMIYGAVPREEVPKKSDIISRVAGSPLNILANTLSEGCFSGCFAHSSHDLMAFIDSTYKKSSAKMDHRNIVVTLAY